MHGVKCSTSSSSVNRLTLSALITHTRATTLSYVVHGCQLPKIIFRDHKPHPLDHTLFLVTISLYAIQQEVPGWKIIHVTNEKLEEQGDTNNMYAYWY